MRLGENVHIISQHICPVISSFVMCVDVVSHTNPYSSQAYYCAIKLRNIWHGSKTTVDGSLHRLYFFYVKAATAKFSNVTVHIFLLLSSFVLVYFCIPAVIMSFLSFSSVPPNVYIYLHVCLNTCIHACCGSS